MVQLLAALRGGNEERRQPDGRWQLHRFWTSNCWRAIFAYLPVVRRGSIQSPSIPPQCTREGPLTIVPQTDVSSARRRGGDPLLFEPIVVHLLSLLLFIFPYRIGAQDQDVMPSIESKQAYDGPEISRTMRAILPFLLRSARTGHLNGTITEPTASLR